ncbi:MAG: flagellar basal body P-ring formation chaperone FlgA [Vicinamibacterales bacterium]
MRVLLRAPMPRAGTTALVPVARRTVRLRVQVPHWHTTHAVARGTAVTEGDLTPVRHVLTNGPLDPPPALADLVGGAALRDLAADACVTARAVTPMPAVRAGEEVVAVVRMGGLEVRAALVAIDAGRPGARVRVRHPESKRTLTARVVGRGEVEVER